MQYCEQASSHINSKEQHGIVVQLIFDISIVEGVKLPPGTSGLKNMFLFQSLNQYSILLI